MARRSNDILILAVLLGAAAPLSSQEPGSSADSTQAGEPSLETAMRARLSPTLRPDMSCTPAPDTTILVFSEVSGRPLRAIGGPSTCLGTPAHVKVTPDGELYVLTGATARGDTVSMSAVTVFGADVFGDVPPLRRFFVPRSIEGPTRGLGLDRRGTVYVQSEAYVELSDRWFSNGRSAPALQSYPPGADSNAVPIRTIVGQKDLYQPYDVAFDSRGDVYVADRSTSFDPNGQISVYAPDAQGKSKPKRILHGYRESGILTPIRVAIGPRDTLFVLNAPAPRLSQCFPQFHYGNVTVYPPYASGKVAPVRTLQIIEETAGGKPAWTALPSVSTPEGLAVDEKGSVYVSVDGPYAVLVYAPGAAGRATPVRAMRWPGFTRSGIAWWRSLARDSRGMLYVMNKPVLGAAGCG